MIPASAKDDLYTDVWVWTKRRVIHPCYSMLPASGAAGWPRFRSEAMPRTFTLTNAAATIPGHTRAVCCDRFCSGFDCVVGYTLKAEAATIPGHTRAACCDELCSSFECGVGLMWTTC